MVFFTQSDHQPQNGGRVAQRCPRDKCPPIIAEEVERYRLTGESDPLYSAWSGGFLERANRAHDDLRGALVCAV